mmetsp:Transcript_2073/g.6048  ORF Transcript_2073/g.6048 Transcript_2073/m.6048 type:complete len:221 (-) Transcript_2073:461-1123(-)
MHRPELRLDLLHERAVRPVLVQHHQQADHRHEAIPAKYGPRGDAHLSLGLAMCAQEAAGEERNEDIERLHKDDALRGGVLLRLRHHQEKRHIGKDNGHRNRYTIGELASRQEGRSVKKHRRKNDKIHEVLSPLRFEEEYRVHARVNARQVAERVVGQIAHHHTTNDVAALDPIFSDSVLARPLGKNAEVDIRLLRARLKFGHQVDQPGLRSAVGAHFQVK